MKSILVWSCSIALAFAAHAASFTLKPVENDVRFSGEFFLSKDVPIQPVPKKTPAPQYPPKMRQAGVEGAAQIAYLINPQGKTEEVQIVKATDESFGIAAAEAVRKWRFKPGKVNDRPVRVVVVQLFPFSIEN